MYHCFKTVLPTNLNKWWWNAGSQFEHTTFQSPTCSCSGSISTLPLQDLSAYIPPYRSYLLGGISGSNFQDSYRWTHSQETQRKLVSPHGIFSNTLHRQHLASTGHTACGNQKRGWGVSKVALYPCSYPWLSCNTHTKMSPFGGLWEKALETSLIKWSLNFAPGFKHIESTALMSVNAFTWPTLDSQQGYLQMRKYKTALFLHRESPCLVLWHC